MFLPVDYFVNRLFRQSIISPVDVLGQKVEVFVVDVLKVNVLEIVQMGRPDLNHVERPKRALS
jgi:hypothetical protein